MKHQIVIWLFVLSPIPLALGACGSSPHKVRPGDDLQSMEIDAADLEKWSGELAKRMLADGFLDRPEYQPRPVYLIVSTTENKTNVIGLRPEWIMGPVRTQLRKSGKVALVGYGDDAADTMPDRASQLSDDPRFDPQSAPRPGNWKQARLSLRTQFIYNSSRTKESRENSYRVRMWITDLQTNVAVWEDLSDTISKRQDKPLIGL